MGISSALGTQALVPAGFGFRNLIINGDFRINQRAFSSTTSSGTYGFDRWFTQHGGGTVTASAQTFTPGNAIQGQEPTNHIRMVTTGQTATNSFGIVCQKIEDVRNGAGQTVTVSFWAKANSGTPSVAIEFEQNFGSGGSPSATVNGIGAQKVVLSTSWNRYTLTFSIPSISSKTIGTTANTSFLQLNMWVSAGSDFNSRTGSLGIQSNTFDFWGVQVELNNVPTNFEQRSIGLELELCQRYFVILGSGELSGSFYAGTASMLFGFFPVQMRTVPIATIPSSPWTNALLDYGVAFRTPSNVQVNALTNKTLTIVAFNGFSATYIPTTWYGGNFLLSAEL